MITGFDCLKRGVLCLVIFFILDLNHAVGQSLLDSLGDLKRMLVRLDNLQEESKYQTSIPLGLELIRKAERLGGPDVGIVSDQARIYLMEAYRELQMFPQLEAAANALQADIEQTSKKKAVTIPDIVSGYGRYILFSDFSVNKKDYKKASSLLHHAIQFVLEYPKFYRLDFIRGYDCKPHRLYQCYDRLGLIALEEQNYAQAKIYFVEGLHFARLADQAIRNGRIADQGCEEKILINLIKMAIKSKETTLLEYYLDAHKNIKKAGAYQVNRNRDLLTTLLQQPDLGRDQGLRLIYRLNQNPLAVADLKTQFIIMDFYLNHQVTGPCRDLIKKLEPCLHHHNQKAGWYLAKAGLANQQASYLQMSQYIDSSFYYLKKEYSEQDIWQDEGLRSQLFATVQKGIFYHNQAYESGQYPSSLNKKIALIEEFILGLKAIRKDLISDYDRLVLVQQLAPLLDLALKTFSDPLLRQKIDFNTVFACFEAGKAFNLLSEFTLKKSVSEIEFKTYNHLKSEQKMIQQQFSHQGADLDQLQKQSAQIQIQLNEYLSSHSPGKLVGFPEISEIQDHLDQYTSLVEFFNGMDYVYILVVNANQVQLLRSPIIQTSFENDLKNLQYSILSADEPDQVNRRDSLYRNSAWNLYRILLQPVEPALKRSVILVPDLALAQIPFAALLDKPALNLKYKQWPYWVHRHSVSIQYSAALWIDQLMGETHRNKREFKFSFTAFAPEFKDLLFNLEECKQLSGMLGKTADYYGTEANRVNFKNQAGHGRILHIASHAQSNLEAQDRSYIRMQEDTLYAGEIGMMNLPMELVFLSACETGTGKIISGEGMMSLARSFFQSGAKGVISTLWPIRDDISKEQVIRIYKNLKKGKRKDEAIRDMQIHYLAESRADEAFPSYWAAFQCHGDLSPLFSHPLRMPAYLLGLAPILAFVFSGWIYQSYKRREKLKHQAA